MNSGLKVSKAFKAVMVGAVFGYTFGVLGCNDDVGNIFAMLLAGVADFNAASRITIR